MKGPVPHVDDGMFFPDTCESNDQNPLPVGSPKWFSWVADAKKFVFTFPDLPGHFSAHKEPHCGKWYWFAYRGRQGKFRRTYLGKPTELTTERLHAIAQQLIQEVDVSKLRPASKVTIPPLRTKLLVPPVHSGEIVHTAAFERLQQAADVPLTTVIAPAGYGKTTLLADWATTLESPLAWVTLDGDDNLPGRLWLYILSALEPIVPGLSSLMFPRSRAPDRCPEQEEIAALSNLLTAAAKPVTLALDNYHQLRRDAQIHDDLAYLIAHLPSNAHIVLASRTEPPLPLTHLRAHGQLNEIHASDLGLTPEEAAQLLANMHITLAAPDRDALYEHIGDWITGWKIAVESLKRATSPHDWVGDFNGSHRHLADYFNDEVLKGVPSETLTFLLHTSILPEFSAPLCDAVTGLTSSRKILDDLQQADLFIEVVDARRQRYRYQPLFAEVLRYQLAQRHPERVEELHRRASAWHAQHGETDLAIEHAAQAGDYDHAAQMIAPLAEQMMAQSDVKMVEHWFAVLPDQIIRKYACLSVLKAYIAAFQGKTAEVEPYLRAAEAGDEMADASPLKGTILAIRATNVAQQGKPHKALSLCRQAVAALPAHHAFRSLLSLDATIAHGMLGEVHDAARRLETIRHQSASLQNRRFVDLSTIYLERARILEGHLSDALELCQHLEAESPRRDCLIDIARIWYERDDLSAAAMHLKRALDEGQTHRVTIMGCSLLANVHRAQGDLEDAAHLIGRALALSGEYDGDLVVFTRALQARLALTRGDVAAASQWAHHYEQMSPRDADEDIIATATLTQAQVALARDLPQDALHLLASMRDSAEESGRLSHVIAILAMQALAQNALGDIQAADESLRRALSLGEPEGFVRTFVDCGPAMLPLLERLHRSGRREKRTIPGQMPGYLARLIQAFDRGTGQAKRRADVPPMPRMPGGAQQPLIEPLSSREIEVLQLLAQGLSNIGLAQELVIAVGTVKRHLSNIFLKLNVQSRTQAIARARALHLIE
jgi:LuxR family transcriptional regulator, maltose regulon positive regulatory protein